MKSFKEHRKDYIDACCEECNEELVVEETEHQGKVI